MAGALIKRKGRRVLGVTAVLLLTWLVYTQHPAWAAAWSTTPEMFTGWLLGGVVVLLFLLNLRKKLTRLPLPRVYNWVWAHVYVGLLSGGLLLAHVGITWPQAGLNKGIRVLFVLVFLSGATGLWLSRFVPRRLTLRAEEVLYERIPAHRHRLYQELQAVLNDATGNNDLLALATFGVDTLVPFFERPRYRLAHLFLANTHQRRLLDQLDAIGRFLNPQGQQIKARLADMIRAKDDLDYTYVHQLLLKYWLFVHIPLSYALLIFIPAHIAWAWLFH